MDAKKQIVKKKKAGALPIRSNKEKVGSSQATTTSSGSRASSVASTATSTATAPYIPQIVPSKAQPKSMHLSNASRLRS